MSDHYYFGLELCTCFHMYAHSCMHTYIHLYICTAYMHTNMRTCMHACILPYKRTFIHTYVCAYMCTCMHACIHTYVATYIHTYITVHGHGRFKGFDWGITTRLVVIAQWLVVGSNTPVVGSYIPARKIQSTTINY